MQKRQEEQAIEQRLELIIEAIRNQKGHGILDIDITKLNSSVCSHYLICDAPSHIQVKAIAEEIEDFLIDRNQEKPLHKEGIQNGYWVLLDYADIVVHIFKTEAREFYKLEELWADGILIKYES